MKGKNVILDFDGVIADTFNFHYRKVNEIYKVKITEDEYRAAFTGNIYSPENKKLAHIDYKDYPKKVALEQREVEPYPEAISSINKLSKDYNLQMVSSGWEEQIFPFLEKHNIKEKFSEFLCADRGTSKHQKLETLVGENVENYIFVTDTVGDVKESRLAGVPVIAVTYGYHSQEDFKNTTPDYFSASWQETCSIIEEYFK